MKANNKVCIRLIEGAWKFVDEDGNTVPFDQAIVDATYVSPERVDGYVVAVHGLPMEVTQYLPLKTLSGLGVNATHRLGHGPTVRRVRLTEGGVMERT